ncbi:MAG: helix-turn-helix domain-containing protein [Aquificota bacterium]|nr:MAG: helix-turn-helix domain-containing protein [Aquificota bacterium]
MRCKYCNYPYNYKQLAIRMFCEGMTMSAIARVLKVPYQTVRTCYSFGMLKS